MTTSKSNDNGRALECIMTQKFTDTFNITITDQSTNLDQERDQIKVNDLPTTLRDNYNLNTDYFVNTIFPQLAPNRSVCDIRRLTDQDAGNGDVTDIQLNLDDLSNFNISLKTNHDACKHQRPGGLIKNQLGILDRKIEKQYKARIKSIENNFFGRIGNINGVFGQLPSNVTFDLYEEICNVYIDYINMHPQNAPIFFRFLIGNDNYFKVINRKSKIEVYNFSNINLPTVMQARLHLQSYIDLTFDNHFILRLRLHTASSRFKTGTTISLKFDTKILTSPIKSTIFDVI